MRDAAECRRCLLALKAKGWQMTAVARSIPFRGSMQDRKRRLYAFMKGSPVVKIEDLPALDAWLERVQVGTLRYRERWVSVAVGGAVLSGDFVPGRPYRRNPRRARVSLAFGAAGPALTINGRTRRL